jgi:hypothetical protein
MRSEPHGALKMIDSCGVPAPSLNKAPSTQAFRGQRVCEERHVVGRKVESRGDRLDVGNGVFL